MNERELIERYIYAVVRQLPGKIKKDVQEELQTLIDDMLNERCKDMPPCLKDIKVILTELGSPLELAQNYNSDKNKYLIGPKYYSNYISLLTIVLASVIFGLFVSFVVGLVMDSNPEAHSLPLKLLDWLSLTMTGSCCAFTFVTLLFSSLERKKIPLDIQKYDLDHLPPVPVRQAVIKRWESTAGIVFNILFTTLFLTTPQVFFVITFDDKRITPIFNSEAIKNAWYVILIIAVLGIIRECFKLYEKQYTKRLAVVTVITNGFSVTFTYIFLFSDNIINSELTTVINNIFTSGQDSTFIINMFQNMNITLFMIIAFALIMDTGNAIIRSVLYDKE